MKSFFVQTRLTVALIGVLLIVLGVAILANPGATTLLVTRLVGWVCALGGVALLVSGFLAGGPAPAGPLPVPVGLVGGGALLVLGILIIVNPAWFANLLLTFLGIGIVFSGLGDVTRADEMRASRRPNWQVAQLVGIVTIVAGVVVVVAPFALVRVASLIAGTLLVADGVSELYLAWRM